MIIIHPYTHAHMLLYPYGCTLPLAFYHTPLTLFVAQDRSGTLDKQEFFRALQSLAFPTYDKDALFRMVDNDVCILCILFFFKQIQIHKHTTHTYTNMHVQSLGFPSYDKDALFRMVDNDVCVLCNFCAKSFLLRTYIHTQTHAHTYTNTCTHIHKHTHTYTNTHTQSLKRLITIFHTFLFLFITFPLTTSCSFLYFYSGPVVLASASLWSSGSAWDIESLSILLKCYYVIIHIIPVLFNLIFTNILCVK